MSTISKTPEEIRAAFSALFANRTDQQQRDDDAQLLSFRFLSEVERIMQEQGFTRRKLAESVGTSPSYITQLFRGDRRLNMDMLARFEQVLGVQFVVSAGQSPVIVATRHKTEQKSRSRSAVSIRRA
ncbi:MAG: helix-turn-helix transcriptional regulator [Bacteroidetes bacterium]|nr:helix-turn-helix transcriptional regulator [Fibrella sp.]